MNQIKITHKKINYFLNLNFETQISPSNRPMRLSGTSKNLQVPEKWIDKTFKNHWLYHFIFLDEKAGIITFEFDYNNNFVGIVKPISDVYKKHFFNND